MSYKEIEQSYLFQETFPNTDKDSHRAMFHTIFWGLLIDILLIITCGAVLILNILRSMKMTKNIKTSEETKMSEKTKNDEKPKLNLVFWITLIRGFLVIVLGVTLIFTPEKTKAMLFNFMGFFWLMTGLVSIRQELHKRGNRLVLFAGALGIVAGILVVTRNLSRQVLSEFWVVEILGIVILLSGIMHILGGFKVGRQAMQGRTTLSIILGIFEVFLGGVFVIFHGGQTPIMYAIAIAWAMIGGVMLLGDAYRQYRASRVS